MNAAGYGFDKCLTLLINAGANVNSIEKRRGFTALTYASLGQHLTSMRILLEVGADVNLRNARDSTTLSDLLSIKYQDKPDVVRLLLEAGAYVNMANCDGFTPLLQAARNGHMKSLEELLVAGADVNSGDKNGITPLIYAASSPGDKHDMVQILIDAGAEPKITVSQL